MLEQCVALFKSFLVFPGLSWSLILIGIILGIVFGAIWLSAHWPPLFQKNWLWLVGIVSAFLTLAAVAFIQSPLQSWTGQALYHFFSEETLMSWLMLAMIPQMLISGLVQEGAKMVPIAFWWWRSGKNISPRMGLAIGAIAGAGYGILEAVAVHNQMFLSGWTTQALQTDGFLAVAGFMERFFTTGFHIAVSALAGYGLAKGKGWQFYLIAAGLHALLNYGVVIVYGGFFTVVQLELYVAVVAIAVTVWALMLRWGRSDEPEAETAGLEDDAAVETEKVQPSVIEPKTDV
jgi:RsiW-degrading membrane proteinase PrsW (M82 family)